MAVSSQMKAACVKAVRRFFLSARVIGSASCSLPRFFHRRSLPRSCPWKAATLVSSMLTRRARLPGGTKRSSAQYQRQPAQAYKRERESEEADASEAPSFTREPLHEHDYILWTLETPWMRRRCEFLLTPPPQRPSTSCDRAPALSVPALSRFSSRSM